MNFEAQYSSHGEVRLQDAAGRQAGGPQAVGHRARVRMHPHVLRQHPHVLLHMKPRRVRSDSDAGAYRNGHVVLLPSTLPRATVPPTTQAYTGGTCERAQACHTSKHRST